MNAMSLKQVVTALALVGLLTSCSNKAPDAASITASPADQAKTPTATPPEPPQAAESEGPATQIPATADGIWQAIDQQSKDLKASINSGSLTDIHHKAFAIRDLVAALPDRSKTLPPEDLAKLQGEVKFVATLADRLDATGDANDKAGAQANYEKLVSVLNGITRTK